ncbi:MAG TPA: exodeoxyribonuclease III [Dongiaceae bacterium]|nr:exodeoxyribonuclease III [Dongiaceae bacterium]
MLTIASFNVNSLRVRMPHLTAWLKSAAPDVALLQEIKCLDEELPRMEIESLGYQVSTVGQKARHGVALLSRAPHRVELRALPGDDGDEQARYLEAVVDVPAPHGRPVRVASIYLPNGNPIDTEKFPYKLLWMDRLNRHARNLLAREEIVVLGGDYNVCPTDEDVFDVIAMSDDALCQPETRRRWRELANLGYVDALRALYPAGRHYTFWDYQAGRWQRDEGLRIDHLMLSPQAADLLEAVGIDKEPRKLDRPSDHTPIWVRLAA